MTRQFLFVYILGIRGKRETKVLCMEYQETKHILLHTFITTNKVVYKDIIETRILCKTVNNSTHVYTTTSKMTKQNTIMSTKSTSHALQLSIVKSPMFAMILKVTAED